MYPLLSEFPVRSSPSVTCRPNKTIIRMFIDLKRATGIFRNLLKTFGAGPKPKQKHGNLERLPDHLNLTYFDAFLLRGIEK